MENGWGAVALALCSGCFAITNLDRFQTEVRGSENYNDLDFKVRAMTSHVAERVEIRVIDADNILQAKTVIEPLGAPQMTITMRNAIPKAKPPYRLDFFADHDKNGGYTPPTADANPDHAWRISPLRDYPKEESSTDGVYRVDFEHNTSFDNLNMWPDRATNNPASELGAAAAFKLTNLPAEWQAKLLEIRVVDHSTGHTSGVYRISTVGQTQYDLKLTGVIDTGVEYDVLVYVDLNANGTYDNPEQGGDLGWKILRPSDSTGLKLDFDAATIGAGKVNVGSPWPPS